MSNLAIFFPVLAAALLALAASQWCSDDAGWVIEPARSQFVHPENSYIRCHHAADCSSWKPMQKTGYCRCPLQSLLLLLRIKCEVLEFAPKFCASTRHQLAASNEVMDRSRRGFQLLLLLLWTSMELQNDCFGAEFQHQLKLLC